MAQWYHVIPVIDNDGPTRVRTGWAVWGEDNETLSRKYDERHRSKTEVVQKAKNLAAPSHPGVVIHASDGHVVDVWVNSKFTSKTENAFSVPKPQLMTKQHGTDI